MNIADAERMIEGLMAEHLYETAQGFDWRWTWDNAKSRAGIARFSRKIIGISRPLAELWDEAEVRDTILHEIAHVLAGPKAQHGPEWKARAREVGARPVSRHKGQVNHRWIGTCPECSKEFGRHRLSERTRNGLCPQCRKRLTWVDTHEVEVTPAVAETASKGVGRKAMTPEERAAARRRTHEAYWARMTPEEREAKLAKRRAAAAARRAAKP